MIDSDLDLFNTYGSELANAVESALPGWVRRSVDQFVSLGSVGGEQTGELTGEITAEMTAEIDAASQAAATDIGGRLRQLLALDIDEQWTNPLSILRSAVKYPTAVLAAHGVSPVERDRHAKRIHPDDIYDLTPGSFSDFGPEVADLGIRWGAAKAHIHMRRRRTT